MKIRETYRQLTKWWKTWRTIPVLEWVQAAALFRSGEYRLAEKFYRKGLKRVPNHVANFCARLDLAYCLFKLGKLSEAEQELKYVTVHLPEMKEAHQRLARLQLWKGHALDAAWTIRRALRIVRPDEELAATFLIAVLENEGPWYLLDEAQEVCKRVASGNGSMSTKIRAGLAFLNMQRGKEEEARSELASICESDQCPAEALVMYGKILLGDEKIAQARRMFRRALAIIPDNPCIQSLLAKSYLAAGPLYNAEYAKQLATQACQRAEWSSPRDMHILAEAYYHVGDKVSALIIASKAKEEGNRLLGSYRDVKSLDQLIDSLQAGSLA